VCMCIYTYIYIYIYMYIYICICTCITRTHAHTHTHTHTHTHIHDSIATRSLSRAGTSLQNLVRTVGNCYPTASNTLASTHNAPKPSYTRAVTSHPAMARFTSMPPQKSRTYLQKSHIYPQKGHINLQKSSIALCASPVCPRPSKELNISTKETYVSAK